MKRLMVGIITLSVSFIGGVLVVPTVEYYCGKAEAHIDIRRGVYKGRRCSGDHIDLEGTQEYERLLREGLNFRIELIDSDSCGPEMLGYNDVQFGHIERVHGVGTVRRILERVVERMYRAHD